MEISMNDLKSMMGVAYVRGMCDAMNDAKRMAEGEEPIHVTSDFVKKAVDELVSELFGEG